MTLNGVITVDASYLCVYLTVSFILLWFVQTLANCLIFGRQYWINLQHSSYCRTSPTYCYHTIWRILTRYFGINSQCLSVQSRLWMQVLSSETWRGSRSVRTKPRAVDATLFSWATLFPAHRLWCFIHQIPNCSLWGRMIFKTYTQIFSVLNNSQITRKFPRRSRH